MNHKKNKGFTLVEVLAAITLLSLVIIGFSAMLIQAQQVVTNNGLRQTAMQIAEKELAAVSKNQIDVTQLANVSSDNLPAHPVAGYNCLYDANAAITQNGGNVKVYLFLKSDGSSGAGSGTSDAITETSPMVVQVYYTDDDYVEVYNTLN
ncbi:MAG: prepilin-type N-terminal cleavage/methylation domain-containing protein [Sporolactobacillus sp.]